MIKIMPISDNYIATNQYSSSINHSYDQTRTPQMCEPAAQSYSSGVLSKNSLNNLNVTSVSFNTDKWSNTIEKNIEINLLSSLVIKHQFEFEAFKLSIFPALKGEKLNVLPDWELDQQKRITLIQILDLLSNMVRRRMFPGSSLITDGFVAALELFESLGIEEQASYLPYCNSLFMHRVIKVTDDNEESELM